jgi:glycosyltransferase involved in cell wall biosynthesis
MAELPMVSCIMPTYCRPQFAQRATYYFLEQDYPNKELIIVDDSHIPLRMDIHSNTEINYHFLRSRQTLGEKRNRAITHSRGDIIIHWDDDDWMAQRRIRQQVEFLLANRAEICGLDKMLFYDTRSGKLWLYAYPPVRKKWLAGGSLCYWKSVWERQNFANISQGEDTQFVWALPECRMTALPDFTFYVALIHAGNTCVKALSGPCWTPWAGARFKELVGADWAFYRSLCAAMRTNQHSAPM